MSPQFSDTRQPYQGHVIPLEVLQDLVWVSQFVNILILLQKIRWLLLEFYYRDCKWNGADLYVLFNDKWRTDIPSLQQRITKG